VRNLGDDCFTHSSSAGELETNTVQDAYRSALYQADTVGGRSDSLFRPRATGLVRNLNVTRKKRPDPLRATSRLSHPAKQQIATAGRESFARLQLSQQGDRPRGVAQLSY